MEGTEGTPFGRYRLIELLGRGGMGEVWRAYDTVTERVVALKVLSTQYVDDAMFQERFRREARSAAALDEPHVVPIYDYGEINGRLFVTMRLIKGRDLHDILSAGRMDPARAVGIIDQVAAALHAAHQANLVHRDVKPSNILVSDDDFAYLIDFGIARAVGQTSLTATSSVIGTWAYMAPERISAGQCDGRADIYALACVLYECLTGRQPFGGDSLEQQIGGHMTLPPPRAADHRPDVSAELDAVIARGMAKNPDDRYATTRELARAARAAVGGPTTGPNTVPPTMAASLMNAEADRRTRFDDATTRYAPQPTGPSPTSPPQLPPTPDSPNPLEAKRSRNGRLIAISSVGAVAVVVAVVAAIALSNPSAHDATHQNSASAMPSALPNTGPFTGTFTAAFGPMTKLDGSPPKNDADAAGFSETWHLRSACSGNTCVASASTADRYPSKDPVFDNVGGRWLAVTTSRRKCASHDDDEAWNTVWLQPQADGTMSGESVQTTANGCSNKRTLTFTRSADTDVSLLPDPATLPRRVASPAEALHGSYDARYNFANGAKSTHQYDVRTDCLRTGERCMSFGYSKEAYQAFAFANRTWTLNVEYDATCPTGGAIHVKRTATLPLPQPPEDLVTSVTGHGYDEVTPKNRCATTAFDLTYTRTGD